MKNSVIWKLVQRYVTGNSSSEDQRKLEQWMDQDSANQQLVKEVKEIWELTPEEDFDVNVQDAWERFSHRKMQSTIHHMSVHEMQKRFRKTLYLYRAAAVILLTLLTGFFVQYHTTNNNTQETAQFYVMQDLTTEKGEKARVTFSDGTQVTLNAAGSLRFPKEFQGAKREVYLDGEAYFKVAHDPEHPFIVHAQGAKVQVLGTEFNIRGWSEDSSVDVAVEEGRVAVNASSSENPQAAPEVILARGQFTRVERGKNPIPAKNINIENYLLWTRGGLHFDNVPFGQVLRHIERKFDVQIRVADTGALKVPFTSTFRQAELDEILHVVAASMEMEYSRAGSEIEFK